MSEFVTMRSKRSVGGLTAMVTVEESHLDTLTITGHPVEQGAEITDHAYKNPSLLTLYLGWSDSGDNQQDYVRSVYDKILKMQESRKPLDVTTGKRNYENMLIESIATTTDETTENALMVTVNLRQIIVVETQTVTMPPRDVQAEPERTAEPVTTGTRQATPAKSANKSALAEIFGDDGVAEEVPG